MEKNALMSYGRIGLYNALRGAGASDTTAKSAVADLPIPQHLATKEDLLKANGEVKTDLAVLKCAYLAYGSIIIGFLIKSSFFD